MAKSTGVQCPVCGEVQFTVINDYKTLDGTIIAIIVCDSCGSTYRKPENFTDDNGYY